MYKRTNIELDIDLVKKAMEFTNQSTIKDVVHYSLKEVIKMNKPKLVDTSVWIEFFNGTETEQVKTLVRYIQEDELIYLCPTIIKEILQGIGNEYQFRKVKDYIMCFNVLNDDSLESAIGAANIYRKLRKKGITIRKSNDYIIANYAHKYNLKILHKDRDFDLIIESDIL